MRQNRRFVGAGLWRRPGLRGIATALGGVQYLLDYADWTISRASEAAFVDPRDGWSFASPVWATFETAPDYDSWDTVTANVTGGELGPTGLSNAWTLEDDSATLYEIVEEVFATAMALGQMIRVRLYVKKDADTSRFPEIQLQDSANAQKYNIDLNTQDGSTAERIATGWRSWSHTVTEPIPGWWLVEMVVESNTTNTFKVDVLPAAGTTLGAVSAAAVGSIVATVPTIEARGSWLPDDQARILADGTILIEGARTNLVTYSSDASAWSTGGTVVTTGGQDAPDGSTTAYRIEDADAGGYGVYTQVVSGSLSIGSYAHSVYVRKDSDETRFPEIAGFQGSAVIGGGDYNVQINTKTGATSTRAGTPTSVSVIDEGLWWRVVIVVSITGAGTVGTRLYPAAGTTLGIVAPGAQGAITVWGVQFEAGSFATSPIRTAGVSATRADDQVTTTVTAAHVDGWLKKDKEWFFDLVLNFSSTDSSSANLTAFCVGNRLIRIYRPGASGGVWILQGGSTLALQVTLTAVPWSAGDTLRFTLRTPDADNWYFKCENLDTGTSSEGTSAGAVTHGTLLGQTMQAGSYQPAPANYYISGVMSRPWHNL